MADHQEQISHDMVNRFLGRENFQPADLWTLVQAQLNDQADSFLLVDDSVQTKKYARFIELVKRQYSAGPPVR